MHVSGKEAYGKSLYHLLNFAMNPKLLQKIKFIFKMYIAKKACHEKEEDIGPTLIVVVI